MAAAKASALARYDVYANPHAAERDRIPFLLDVQNSFLAQIDTRVVVPLWARGVLQRAVQRLNPELQVRGQPVTMDTAALAAVPTALLRHPVDNLGSQQFSIQDALDTLFGPY